jgi:hypothetical protein
MMWDEMDLVEATLAVRLVGVLSVILNLTVSGAIIHPRLTRIKKPTVKILRILGFPRGPKIFSFPEEKTLV